jgi:hypothetical protein
MHSFLNRFASLVSGVLCGLDRLSLYGSLRMISFQLGLQNYLWAQRVRFKDFDEHSEKVTAQLEEASLKLARQQGREIRYLNSSQHNKENIAREIAERDGIKNGLICVLTSVDPCMSFEIRKNRASRKLEIRYRQRKCLHLYHYQIHPVFGFMHARIQTWFPFRVYVCINGREWLARQMDQTGLHYIKRNNTFTWLEDVAAAQALFDQQLQANWPTLLGGLTDALNPVHQDIFANFPCNYYWSIRDSEWASDVMFRSRDALQSIYPRLIRYAINSFSAVDVLRFLGQPVSASGKVPHRRRFEVSTNVKERLEGVRIKHWLNGNSIKLYDKYSVLRPETMIHDPGDFKVLRPAEGEPDDSPPDWRPLRKGLADLHRRAEISQAANERYLEALAAVHDSTPMRQLLEPLCRPTANLTPPLATPRLAPNAEAACATPASALDAAATESPTPAARQRRARALNPLAPDDAALLEAVGRHEFMINGLRNRDLRRLLFSTDTVPDSEQRTRSAAVTRKLRLLRAHGLIDKVAKSHRYQVTEHGRKAITAFLAARSASTEQLTSFAA